jgi:hypothetical protein
MYPDNVLAQELFESIDARCVELEAKVLPVIKRFKNLFKDEQKRYLEDPKLKEYVPFLLSKMESPTKVDISKDVSYQAARSRWKADSDVANDKVDQMETVSIIRDMEGNDPEIRNNSEARFNQVSKDLLPISAKALNSLMALSLI